MELVSIVSDIPCTQVGALFATGSPIAARVHCQHNAPPPYGICVTAPLYQAVPVRPYLVAGRTWLGPANLRAGVRLRCVRPTVGGEYGGAGQLRRR